jgi:hypothetical protein
MAWRQSCRVPGNLRADAVYVNHLRACDRS